MKSERVEDIHPLTPLQRGILFHTVLAPEAGDYLAQLCFTLDGALDAGAFERAWQTVAARHPALRSAFVWQGVDEPVQVVLRDAAVPFERADWRELAPAEQRERTSAFLTADRRRGFALARAPLQRVHLARVAERRWRVTWTSHHLLLDGWSVPLVLREVLALHAALAHGRDAALAPARPYRDYVAWLAARDPAPSRAFWKERLAGARPTPLPGVRERSAAASARDGARDSWGDAFLDLSVEETERAAAFARRHGLTFATLVQGAWALLLAKQSGEHDVVFGIARSGRPAELEGVESMVGMFVNTLPLRVDVETGSTALGWLKEVQGRAAELAPHEWSALTDVAAWSGVEPGTSLFESLVVFENYPFSEMASKMSSETENDAHAERNGELALTDVTSLERTSYPVNLVATPGPRLSLRLSYDPARMDGALAERWLAGLRRLLLELALRPDAALASLSPLGGEERRMLLEDWAPGGEPALEPAAIAELFESAALRTPDARAVECGATALTYAELDRAANALARALAERGAGPERVVGLCLPRTEALAAAILAVAKAGAAWLPLDPSYPPARLLELARDARIDALLLDRGAERRFPELAASVAGRIVIDDPPPAGDAARLSPRARPDELAYVIHTSGSTGVPKGVEVSHRGLGNLARATADAARLGPRRRVAQLSSIGFDVSVLEILSALLSGSTLVLFGEDRPPPGPELAQRLAASGANVLFAPPSVLRELDPALLPSVDTVFSGGEPCTSELAAAWRPGRRFINAYGPAEASCTAAQDVGDGQHGAPPAATAPPAIGRPLPGVRAHVLDAELEPVPIGAVGELFLGGIGVARGYRGRRALTAERFVPDPYSPEHGARLYRTGDLARWRPLASGGAKLEFCGRADGQLKIRGVRAEPGEIEAALLAHPLVRAAAVGLAPPAAGEREQRLVAWYAPRAPARPDAAELRRHLAERLPPALVPSVFEPLAALPLTPSGKIDRAALPAPGTSGAAFAHQRYPRRTRTPLEDLVCLEAAAVLGARDVDVGDDFFALGGHSLRAMQLASRVRTALEVELELAEIFAAPTLGDLARAIEERRQSGKGPARELPDPAEFAGRRGPQPLSFAQQRLWFLDRFEPESPLYVVPAAVRLLGPLDEDALERALSKLVQRHAALRTRILDGGDGPRQVADERFKLRLARVDLRAAPDRDERALELAREESQRAFDLAAGPLVRASLLRLAAERRVLLLALHHAAADGWSIGILVRELGALYAAETGGPAAALPALPLSYADYAAWQRDPRVAAAIDADVAYFAAELAGAPALELPTDRPRPPMQTFAGKSQCRALEPELFAALERLARRRGATPFMALLAAFQVWLARLADQDDVVVGVPVAGRNRPGLEPLVGLFVNTLALRGRLAGNPTFLAHLARTRECVLGAWDHQDAPFERLVERLTERRDLSRPPLAQVLFVLQDLAASELSLPGLSAEVLDLDTGTSKFDLSLLVDRAGTSSESARGAPGALRLTLEYNTDLFDDSTASAWLASFHELLRSIAADPGRGVFDLEWVPAEERALVTESLGVAPASHPRDATVPALFAAQAARTPDAVAAAFQGATLTYRELDERSNRLARRLRALGVGPEVRVAVTCERSLEMIVALLAVLKAGGAYVPLDPLYPLERRRWMLASSAAKVLLLQGRVDLSAPAGVQSITAGDEAGKSSAPLEPSARAESLAYLMYTSGSTGVPKGVGVPHRALVRLLCGTPVADLGPGETLLQFVSAAFDVSAFEIFGALLHGARLEIFPPHLPSLEELGAFVRERGVTTLWLTTGLFNQMVDAELESLRGARQILAGGEALSAPHVERVLRELPHCRMINGYGPTEVTCFTTTHEFAPGSAVPAPVPIGRPINGTRVYVLDRRRRLVPRGVRGELYAAGDGLARGYLNDPALTAARFVPNPFGGAGERLYRIGDLARWRSDGTLEFCGRADRQVKVRGYRIELGEIEAALLEHPAVRQCAVELRGSGERGRPVAWIATSAPVTPRELRDFLRATLPEPVLPAFFVVLAELPLTPNGKVDRRALVEPDARAGDAAAGARARTPEEELLAGAWQELLATGRVGPEDDFFELGGHSLLATRLVARIRELFGVELPLRRVFEHPTLAELAREIAALSDAGAGAGERLALEPRSAGAGPLPLSFAQARLWFLERYAPGNPAHHTPLALELAGELRPGALRAAFEALVRRHEVLRTRFAERDGEPAQVVAPCDSVAFELPIEDVAELAEDARAARLAALAQDEIRRSFDLEHGLPLRARLARVEERRHLLWIALHHIASDGWSLSILMRELSELYGAELAGARPELAGVELQYADYALWERRALSGERLLRLFEWWRAELDGATGRLELPGTAAQSLDASATPGAGLRPGAGFDLRVPPELVLALERLGRREGATLFMVLLAAFQALLARAAGRERLVVGAPIGARALRETEDLVGPLVNLLALRGDFRGNPPFREVLARVREATLGAYAHAELPVERLAHLLRPDGNPRGGELFQATFTFHNAPAAVLELPGLSVRRLDVDTGVAFGELWLSVETAHDGALEAYWHYDAGLFTRRDVERLAAAWLRFLERAAAEPAVRFFELPLTAGEERAALLTWGTGPAAHPRDVTLVELLERRARRAPDAVAVACEGAQLRYGELARRANRLAHRLRALGVGPDVPVAIACERSLELVVGLLGILKAGGAYVPLDPAWPERRFARALELSRAALLLAHERVQDELPAAPGGAFVLPLDRADSAFAQESADDLAPLARAENLAYVMFTSGSTGEPKPVGVSHRAVVRLLAGEPFAELSDDDAVLGLAPLAFDASTFEIWAPLLAGARLELFAPRTPSLAELGAFVRERGVTALWLTAGLFHQMIDERAEDLRGVRQLLAGGEALSPPHVARALAALPRCRLVNGYGPTEVTTFTCCHPIARSPAPSVSVPIGRPINGTRVYVLDPRGELVPIGAWGELYAGGDGVARGYLGDPRLTAERFVPDPFSGERGARLFRTGDRARWREDGTLEFGGRFDRQIKLRGFRIEPAEIEAALAEHPAVRAAVVEPRGEGAGRRLVAWVAADAPLEPAELRRHLRARLAEPLVPSSFAVLAELPLSANGKVDRGALLEPQADDAAAAADPPRTPEEELVAGLFGELLACGRVARGDDFFELGGHSLLATQLVSRVHELFGVDLSLQRVFEAPTPAGLADAIAAERALRRDEHTEARPPLRAAPRDGAEIPLSFGQERLWFLERLAPGRPIYHAPFALELSGALDVQALGAAFGALVRRHESLRTAFPARDGVPRQVIAPPPDGALELLLHDLSVLAEAEQRLQLLRLEQDVARRPFDLAAGPLLRAELVRLAPSVHVLLLCLHHAISDGWSLAVLLREVSELYRAAALGCEPRLEPLAVQVADHALWQRAWMSGERLERELAWWRAELGGAPERIELAPRAAHARPEQARGRAAPGALLQMELPAELAAALERLARREGATLFMVLLAAFQALLGRLSGSRTVVVGTPIAGRGTRASEGLIGFLVNTLALRGDVGGEPELGELLARVRRRALDAYEHQDLPFERLVGELWPASDARGGAPLQVLFALQNAPAARLELSGLEVRGRPLETGEAHAELLLAVERAEHGGLSAAFEYDTGLFERREIEALARTWRSFLEHAAASSKVRLAALPLLAPAERELELARARGPRGGAPRDAGLFELFQRAAARDPGAVAVEAGGRSLTYRELERGARGVAAALVAAGVGREELVGLAAARADEIAFGALGALAADAAWLPLDPAQPDERMRRILADARVRVVLCEEHLCARIEALGARAIALEESAGSGGATRLPDVRGRGAALAYAIYTSGSTGEPKGVCVPQRAVARLVLEPGYVELGPGSRVARASNPAFDAVLFEVFGALLNGATLVDVERDTALSPRALAAALRERRISHLFLTTALFHAVAREAPDAFGSLEALLFGGERCDPELVRAVLATRAPRRLLHVYGPTETATFACWHELAELGREAAQVPIGMPIAATELYVLDRALEPVPPGLCGELYIGGDGLARGYLGRGAATAASFVPHPFSAEPGARLYRTGDVVQRDGGGRLVFVGRRDAQIKLRGFRVEPGEIEAALERCQGVREAVVQMRQATGGEPRIVAWITARDGARPNPKDLRRELGERLPPYMLPSAFVLLDALPLGPTGKVDRAALPDPDEEGGAERAGRPLSSPLEELVAAIFCAVLGRERAGADDDFFELGGHSLLAAQVISRLSAAIGAELSLRALFEAPTVRGLAERAEAARGARGSPPPPVYASRAEPPSGAREGPLSSAQQRLWFLQRLKPESSFYNVPIALRVRGAFDAGAWQRALGAFAARHEPLRTRIVAGAEGPRQVVDPPGEVRVRRFDLRPREDAERERELERLLREECLAPLDLALGPPWRAAVIALSSELHVATFVVHHAMADGWSLGVLMRELGELYRAETEGRPADLAPLATGYVDAARAQRERLSGARGAEHLAWWRERLRGAPEALDLAPDHPRPAVQGFRGSTVPCALSAELSRGIRELARAEGATPFMALLAGFLVLLRRRSGQRDLCVGTPVAGRDRPELEGLFGLFVDTLVLRVDLADDPSFRELVRRARAAVLEAFDHRDVPFERVVEAVRPERDPSRSPLFQTMFALQSAPLAPLVLPGAAVEVLELEGTTAKFDLSLALSEHSAAADEAPAGDESAKAVEAPAFAGAFEYDADLFERPTVERMASAYARLLSSAVADPDRPISRLAWLSESERAHVLALGRGPRASAADSPLVHELFERRARAAPDALAVSGPTGALTYAELDRRASRLAQRLRGLGVGPEVVVGLCAARSSELVLGALAALKSGGAYLALDKEAPPERTRAMLADARAAVLLADGPLADSSWCSHVLRLDEIDLSSGPAAAPAPAPAAGNTAYVIYTSGSTGRPKGVAVPHAGLANLVLWHARAYGVTAADRATLLAGTAFDASVWELWPYLASGASLHAVPEDVRLDPPRLVEWMAGQAITIAFLPTPLAEAVLELEFPARAALRALLAGGDRLHGPGSAPRAFTLFNHYGPSEASVVTTACAVPADGAALPPPIGNAIDGVRVLVLDEHLEPVPIGVPGELYIAGAGLARGYLRRPALTAEAFVPNPHAGVPGERLYRSGDVVRWGADGMLRFLGRADRQIKLHGQRLELGEVEALLAQDPSVKEAVVVARGSERGARGLVAYVVPNAGQRLDAAALSQRLRRSLAQALVPASWVEIAALPLSASGKVDRAALPAPADEPSGGEVLPATATERAVAAVWSAVLARARVCAAANFFDQGGTSLALLDVHARLRAELGRDVPVIELFRHPTVASLARWLEDGAPKEPSAGSLRAEARLAARGRRRRGG